jgi:flagellar assembly protein FliH
MGLIKSQHAPPTLQAFSLADVEAHARAIVARARQQADQLVSEAHFEGAKIRQNSYDQGFAAGTEDGIKKGTEDGRAAGKQAAMAEQKVKLEQLAKSLTSAVTELNTSRAKLESVAATEVIRLAVAIARRVTKLQGSLDPTVLTENVKSAMQLVVHSTDVRIALHPTQKQTLADALPQLRVQWPNVKHIELIEDPKLAPGGCRVFTAAGEVDADLDAQIDRVAADLLPSREDKGTRGQGDKETS